MIFKKINGFSWLAYFGKPMSNCPVGQMNGSNLHTREENMIPTMVNVMLMEEISIELIGN